MERVRTLSRTLPRAAFAVCVAWLLLYELRAVAAPSLDAGPLTSRFSHDVVLLASSLLILARAATAPRERVAWLLIGSGVLAWSLGEVYYTAVLWDAEVIGIPAPAVGRRRDRGPRRGRPERHARVRDRARHRRGQCRGSRDEPRLPARRSRPVESDRGHAGRHRLAPGSHLDAAGDRRLDLLAGRLALPRPDRGGDVHLRRADRHRLVGRAAVDRGGRLAAPARARARPAGGKPAAHRRAARLRPGRPRAA